MKFTMYLWLSYLPDGKAHKDIRIKNDIKLDFIPNEGMIFIYDGPELKVQEVKYNVLSKRFNLFFAPERFGNSSNFESALTHMKNHGWKRASGEDINVSKIMLSVLGNKR